MRWGEAIRAVLVCLPQLLALLTRWLEGRDSRRARAELAGLRLALARGDADDLSRLLRGVLED